MDLDEWLRGLGLEQYAPAFRNNDIDGEVLLRLTAEDLRELGVASIGHRRRLLDAIAALGAGEAIGSIGSSPLPNPPPHAGEGRVGAGVTGGMFLSTASRTPIALFSLRTPSRNCRLSLPDCGRNRAECRRVDPD